MRGLKVLTHRAIQYLRLSHSISWHPGDQSRSIMTPAPGSEKTSLFISLNDAVAAVDLLI